MKKYSLAFLCVAFLLVSVLSGCGGGGSTSIPPVVIDISGGTDVDVSPVNGRQIYSINTYMDKTESNYDPDFPITLHPATLTINVSGYSGNIVSLSKASIKSSSFGVYSEKQTAVDQEMRQFERKMLASGVRQFSKLNSFNPSISPIEDGTKWDNVNIIVTDSPTKITTTCKLISDHAYFFVEDADITAMTPYLESFATAFDKIYDVNHTHFGAENDVDNNGKVIIVFSDKLSGGLLGYFFPGDKYEYNATTNPYTNYGDIFYLTTDPSYLQYIPGTLAHEFQHMIYFDQHYNQGVEDSYDWLNEALSQAAEYYNNYLDNHLDWIRSFLYYETEYNNYQNWYWLSLTHWTPDNYGYGAIFIRYLIDQYGDSAILKIAQSPKIGIAAVEEATGQDFNTIFMNFSRALLLSDTGTTNPLYKYKTLYLKSLQPEGRGGLYVPFRARAGGVYQVDVYPYNLTVINFTGTFGTMNLSAGNGTAIGY